MKIPLVNGDMLKVTEDIAFALVKGWKGELPGKKNDAFVHVTKRPPVESCWKYTVNIVFVALLAGMLAGVAKNAVFVKNTVKFVPPDPSIVRFVEEV